MPGSRLLPAEQRSALPAAPTTSRWWRTHVLLRSWLNRHRHRWLAPLLLCAPPVGVAMVWAGATRPGHSRRWLTAGAAVWTVVLVLAVVAFTLPGASPADAGAAPAALAGGPASTTSAPTA